MKNDWLSWMDSDPNLFPFEPFLFFLDNSKTFYETSAIEEAFGRVSKFAGALLFWFSGGGGGGGFGNVNLKVKPVITNNVAPRFGFGFGSKRKTCERVSLGKISNFVFRLFWREAKRIQSFPVLSIAAALVPPIQNLYVYYDLMI